MQLCFAPMDGITTCATRLITQQIFQKHRNLNDELALRTEFMNVDGFLINPNQVIKHILTTPWQKPIAQIYGWNEKTLLEAAEKIQHEYSQIFGWIELNTWCPSNTVMKVGWWSDMLRDKEKTLKIIQRLSEISGNLPFSLKSRAWLNESDKDEQMEFLIEASKYCDKISIHGRTLKQLYSGDADWNFISKLKERIWSTKCKVIGNWWIISYSDAKEKIQNYGLDGIMIGQAAIWNPWIFTDYEPTINEKRDIILQHLRYSIACDWWFDERIASKAWNITIEDLEIPTERLEKKCIEIEKESEISSHAIIEFRKFLFQYVKWISWSKERKQQTLTCKTYSEIKNQILNLFK